MRRRSVAPIQAFCCSPLRPLVSQLRLLRRGLSPDRTPDEEIQDRQNAFSWESRHLFRPHQHFTYDPSSWSRPLTEKVKASKRLTLIDRLRSLEERLAESDPTARTMPEAGAASSAPESQDSLEKPDLASSVSLDSWDDVPLQELLDEVQRLRRLLCCPRSGTGSGSLRRRARQRERFHSVLLHTYDRLEKAVVNETVSLDALGYSWYVVLGSIGHLLEALQQVRQPNADEPAIILSVFDSLQRTYLQVVCADTAHQAQLCRSASLEGLVEVLDVVTHFYTRKCASARGDASLIRTLQSASAVYTEAVMSRLADRMATAENTVTLDSPSRSEWLDPTHTASLLKAVHHQQTGTSDLPVGWIRLCLLVRRCANVVLDVLRESTAPSLRRRLQRTLVGLEPSYDFKARRPYVAAKDGAIPQKDQWEHKPVVLESTSAPLGIQMPHTEPDDVTGVLRACTALLRLADVRKMRQSASKALDEVLDAVLELLSHTPNYDLDLGVVVAWACAVLRLHAATSDSQDGPASSGRALQTRSLRLITLLSRLQYFLVRDRQLLCQLLILICRLPPPRVEGKREQADWLRLRGVVVRRLLDTCTASELLEYDNQNAATDSWEEVLAFGHVTSTVPLALWRDACQHRFYCIEPGATPNHSPSCTPRTAEALFVLYARYTDGPSRVTRPALDGGTVAYLSEAVSVLSGGAVSSTRLLQSEDAWDEVPRWLHEEHNSVSQLLGEVKTRVRESLAAAKHVMKMPRV